MRALPVIGFLLLAACPVTPANLADGGVQVEGTANDGGTTNDAGTANDAGTVAAHLPLPAEAAVSHDVFATARVCADCHRTATPSTANRDEQGRGVGLYEQWSASVMGNAARDPLFRAALAGEIARAPAAADAIAGVCLTCHAGMGRHAQLHAGATTTFALLSAQTNEGALARDGVSCALCHQVQPTNLGQDSSFSGGYQFGTTKQVFGPYAAPFAMPMVNRTGFTPTEGLHVQSSALCGTCHALVTEALTPAGVGTGHQMGEQLTYLEWRRSAFSTEGGGATPTSCQTCHLRDTRDDGGPLLTRLAHKPDGTDWAQLSPRGPFSRHGFTGPNTLLPRLLRAGRALLTPAAGDAALVAQETASRELLRTASARVSLLAPTWTAGVLRFSVGLENLTGHKFPSAYPSRRAFLHVRVFDAGGALLFETGRTDGDGRLLGGDGQPLSAEVLGGPFHPHRTEVTAASEVPVYESVMDDGHGGPSYALLGAEGFVKDDRLLPKGHLDTTTGPLSTLPVGVRDADFGAGGDRVSFALPLGATPARVEARLEYQTFSPRYLDELLRRPTPEATALRSMLQPGMLAPELVDETTAQVP